jgi:hypothetical protein
VERDTQFLHGEAVVDLQGEVVQEDGLVSLEEEPVLDLAYGLLAVLGLLVLLRDRLEDVLLLALVGVARLHHRDLLLVSSVGHLDLLDNLLVFEVDCIHLSRHLELVLCTLLSQ